METWEGTPRDAGWCEARQEPGPGDETLRGFGGVGHVRGKVGTPDTQMQTAPLGRVPNGGACVHCPVPGTCFSSSLRPTLLA